MCSKTTHQLSKSKFSFEVSNEPKWSSPLSFFKHFLSFFLNVHMPTQHYMENMNFKMYIMTSQLDNSFTLKQAIQEHHCHGNRDKVLFTIWKLILPSRTRAKAETCQQQISQEQQGIACQFHTWIPTQKVDEPT